MKNEYWNWPPHFFIFHHSIVSGVSCSNSILRFLSSKLSSFWSLFSLLDFFVGWLFKTELLLGEGERGLGDDTWTWLSSWTCSSRPWRKLNLRCFVQVGSITLFYYHGHFFTNPRRPVTKWRPKIGNRKNLDNWPNLVFSFLLCAENIVVVVVILLVGVVVLLKVGQAKRSGGCRSLLGLSCSLEFLHRHHLVLTHNSTRPSSGKVLKELELVVGTQVVLAKK